MIAARPLAIIVLVAVGAGALEARTPTLPDTIPWQELARQAEIRRDAYGVPHIRAETVGAAGFALAWVQLEDYGQRVVTGLVRARGESAFVLGAEEGSVQGDIRARRDHRRALETFHLLAPEVRAIYDGFARGVNRYLEVYPDEVPEAAGLRFSGHDVLARDVVGAAWSAASRFLGTLDDPSEAEGGEPGSNTWAFAPSRTASGHAILMRNPHLAWTAGYYEAQVHVPGVLHFHGDFRIGGPFGIIGGFNDRLGWSTTNNGPDLTEVYALFPDPSRADHVLFDGASIPLERVVTAVSVRDGEEFRTESHDSWESTLGPVIHRTDDRVYVLRSAGDGEYRLGEQFYRMMTARNLDEWLEAMRMRARTQSNIIYADADGNIYYVWNASHPDRPHAPGGDTIAVEARGSDDVWTHLVPFDSLPQLLNPPGGYVQNENDPFHYTNLNAVLPPGRFPADFPEPRVRLRSQRSLELIHAGPDGGITLVGDAPASALTLDDVWELKHDSRMALADRVLDDLVESVRSAVAEGGTDGPSEELGRAADLLERWDRTTRPDARGAVLFAEWWDRYLGGAERTSSSPESAGFSATPESVFATAWSAEAPVGTPLGLADPARATLALSEAMERTTERWGSWDVAWGEVHRARHGGLDLPVGGCDGILGCFRVLWFTDDDDGRRRVRGGDGWVFAVEFGETPRAYTVLAYGQSAREDSPHHMDQLRLFVEGGRKTVAFTEEAVGAAATRSYRPGSSSDTPP